MISQIVLIKNINTLYNQFIFKHQIGVKNNIYITYEDACYCLNKYLTTNSVTINNLSMHQANLNALISVALNPYIHFGYKEDKLNLDKLSTYLTIRNFSLFLEEINDVIEEISKNSHRQHTEDIINYLKEDNTNIVNIICCTNLRNKLLTFYPTCNILPIIPNNCTCCDNCFY
jgi:hypothetical protein